MYQVLLVDDEALITDGLAEYLAEYSYTSVEDQEFARYLPLWQIAPPESPL